MGPRGFRMRGGVGGYKLHESAAATRSRGMQPTGMGAWLNLHRRLDEAAFERADTPAVQRALAAVEAESRDRGARVLREIHVNALSTAGEPTHRSRTPANSSTPKALLALAGKCGRPLNIHAPWDHRFAVGVDLAAGDKQHAHSVRAIGFGLLAHLPPATAEKAASWNAGLGFGLR